MRFLLGTTEAGVPVDVALNVVQVSDADTENNPIIFQDVTGDTGTTVPKTGMLDLEIDLPNDDDKIFEFKVEHVHSIAQGSTSSGETYEGPYSHFGTIVVHHDEENNLGAGQ